MNTDAHKTIRVSDLIQALDWSQTAIGPMEAWPQSLKATIKTILGSRYPMILLWGKTLIQIYNDAYTNLIGDKHPYALGRSIKETQAESWETIGPMIQHVMTTGIPNWVPAQLLAVNRFGFNEETYFSLSYSAVENDEDVITGMLCVCSEVTQQVLGERRLRLQRDLASKAGEIRSVEKVCKDIANALSDHPSDIPFAAIYIKDTDGKLNLRGTISINDDVICPPTFDPKSAEPDPWSLRRALTGETVLTNTVPSSISLKGGPWNERIQKAITLPIASSIPNDPFGVLIAAISPNCVLDDNYKSFFELLAGQVSVALRNAQAYEEERKRAEALALIDKAKTDFFSNVSHEFRTPLTLLLGPLKGLLTTPEHLFTTDVRQELDAVYQNALRLLKLVNTLLDFSRIEANRAQAVYRPFDLSALTIELASSFESAIKKASLEFDIDCPPVSEMIYIDHQMWEKIIFNLLSNALKFTFTGSIRITLRETPSNVVLTVSDTGVGIPQHELPNIFTRFHRIQNSRSRSHEGTGIGLALVKELVLMHGGTIDVTSLENKGTTFTISIPKGTAHIDTSAIPASAPDVITGTLNETYVSEATTWSDDKVIIDHPREKATHAKKHLSGINDLILIVDDNVHMLRYLQKILGAHWKTVTAKNGLQALQLMQQEKPALILSDVMMPEMDGFQFLAELRKNVEWNNIPIILLSARAGQEATVEGLQKGANDYLVKPFYAEELIARVATQLEIKHTRLDNLILQESEKKFRKVAESIPEKVWTCDPTGAFTFCNEQMNQFTGSTSQAPKSWSEFIHPEDENNLMGMWSNGIPFKTECRLRSPESEYLWHLIKAVPEMDPEGNVIAWIGSCTDIHNQKLFTAQLEKKVRERTVDLDNINNELEQFAYAASHDLQEPLRKIMAFAEMIEFKILNKKEDVIPYLKKITASSDKMRSLIKDLLNFSRLSQADQQFQLIDLNSVIEALREDFELTILQKDARIEYDRLPAIEAIPLQMNQLFYNLISNALKFTQDNRQPHIQIQCKELHQHEIKNFHELNESVRHYRIDFIDNGVGFDQKYADQIFSLFKRLQSSYRYAGTGIGLSLCKKIVLNHKGKIFATAEKDRGAVFTVILPEKRLVME